MTAVTARAIRPEPVRPRPSPAPEPGRPTERRAGVGACRDASPGQVHERQGEHREHPRHGAEPPVGLATDGRPHVEQHVEERGMPVLAQCGRDVTDRQAGDVGRQGLVEPQTRAGHEAQHQADQHGDGGDGEQESIHDGCGEALVDRRPHLRSVASPGRAGSGCSGSVVVWSVVFVMARSSVAAAPPWFRVRPAFCGPRSWGPEGTPDPIRCPCRNEDPHCPSSRSVSADSQPVLSRPAAVPVRVQLGAAAACAGPPRRPASSRTTTAARTRGPGRPSPRGARGRPGGVAPGR